MFKCKGVYQGEEADDEIHAVKLEISEWPLLWYKSPATRNDLKKVGLIYLHGVDAEYCDGEGYGFRAVQSLAE